MLLPSALPCERTTRSKSALSPPMLSTAMVTTPTSAMSTLSTTTPGPIAPLSPPSDSEMFVEPHAILQSCLALQHLLQLEVGPCSPRTPQRQVITTTVPRTPRPVTHLGKRRRCASDDERDDFDPRDILPFLSPKRKRRGEAPEKEWTVEEDKRLVAIVLQKTLQLSTRDWSDCARALGRLDTRSVTRRWLSLMSSLHLVGERADLRPCSRAAG